MSERKPKYIVKKIHADSVPAAEAVDNRENAPAAQAAPAAPEAAAKKKKKGKKSRRGRMSVRLAAVLMVIAMLFGIVVGYAIGRSAGANRLVAAEQRVDELTDAAEEAGRTEIDIFTDNLSAANREALADLSGMSMQTGNSNVFLGGDDFSLAEESVLSDPEVVAEFEGGALMSDEVRRRYNEQLTGYVFSGYTETEVAEALLSEVMQDMVMERVMQLKAQSMGLYELSDADRQQIEAEAVQSYAALLEQYKEFVYAEGMTDAQAGDAAAAFLQEIEGVSLDSIRAELEANWWEKKLRRSVAGNVQPDSSAILAAYNEKLSEQKERFSASPAAFEAAQAEGEIILYNLAGYRAVKPLVLKLDEAQQEALRSAADQAAVDAVYAPLEARAQEILGWLASGESFDRLLNGYGEDEGMKTSPLKDMGYYISANSDRWDKNVIQAAMALAAPGDISAPVRGLDGLYILQFAGNVPGGEVDMAKVYDAMIADAITDAQDAAFEAQKEAWLAEADVKYYPERMQ